MTSVTHGERVKEARKKLGLTLDKFGERIGVGKSAISNIERGNRGLTEQMIKSICREFNVNENWLRTGTGEMFINVTPYDVAYNRFGYIMENSSASKKAALSMLLELLYTVPDDTWNTIMRQFDEIKKEG